MHTCKCGENVIDGRIRCGWCGRPAPALESYNKQIKYKKKPVGESEQPSNAVDVLVETDLQKAIRANKV